MWVALLFWWLSPEVASVRAKINEHNAQVQQALGE